MTATKLCILVLSAALASTDANVGAAPADAQTCEGDCNVDGSVAIDEIVLGVRIAFGTPIGDCPAMDADASGAVTVDELVAAVRRGLRGCGGPVPPTPTNTPLPTDVPVAPTSTPTRTGTPVPTTSDEAVLAAPARVATDPILRFFDLQASLATTVSVAERARAAAGGSEAVSGCQQLDCSLFGTQEVCCSDTQFSQFFDGCTFDDELGRTSLFGLYVLLSDSADVCTGAIPAGASFAASLSSFTRDVSLPDGGFSRTSHELSEIFEAATPGGCTVGQPDQFGLGIRGDGRRFIDGRVQQFQGDGSGNILVDIESDAHLLGIEVGSTREPDGCMVAAALSGSMTNADVRVGTQFTTNFIDFHVVQHPQAGALLLGLDGTVDTDCVGDVMLSTIEPVRFAPGDTCFTAGRLGVQSENGTASVTYTESDGLDLDFDADGIVDQHFATCTDVPVDECSTSAVGLCGVCSALDKCQTGLVCFGCSRNCSGDTSRCSLSDKFVSCEDGVF